MKWLFAILMMTQFSHAMGNCNVYVPTKEFNVAGYVISFDFTQLLASKGYKEVYTAEEATHQILVEGIEQEGRIHRAVGVISMGDIKADESVLCFTQLCGLNDYAKAFNKSYKKISRLIPVCQ